MAVIYYPKSSEILSREVSGSQGAESMVETHIALQPNAYVTFTGSVDPSISYSASYALTSSLATNVSAAIVSASKIQVGELFGVQKGPYSEITLSADIYPTVDNYWFLGNSTNRFGNIYAGDFYGAFNGTASWATNITPSANLVLSWSNGMVLYAGDGVSGSGVVIKSTSIPETDLVITDNGIEVQEMIYTSVSRPHTQLMARISTGYVRPVATGSLLQYSASYAQTSSCASTAISSSYALTASYASSGPLAWSYFTPISRSSNNTTDTDETSLTTFTLPGGTLGPNDWMRITSLWTWTSGLPTQKRAIIEFSGSEFMNFSTTTNTALYQGMTLISNMNSTSSQMGASEFFAGLGTSGFDQVVTTIDTGIDQIIDFRCKWVANVTSSDYIQLERYLIEIIRANPTA